MPNHCQNYLVLGHKDSREIGRAKLAILEDNFFQEFHPCPKGLNDRKLYLYSKENAAEEDRARQAAYDTYGYADGNEWRRVNWGTKWDAYDIEIVSERYDTDVAELTVVFDTAWAPPTEFYNELVEQGFEVDAMYNEFGYGFCGHYTDGTEYYIEYTNDKRDEIPAEIDEQFGIIETLEMWSEDEEEEETSEE